MQPITISNFNSPNRKIGNDKVAFTGMSLALMDSEISQRAYKLVKKAGQLIDDTWTKNKKKSLNVIPQIVKKCDNETITMRPVYNFSREAILIEINDGANAERIILDRVNPNKFRYEKSVKTDFGSATVKTYNSQNGKDENMIIKVNDLIEKYFPKFVKEDPLKKLHKIEL